jgi:hypothetical protein
MSQRDDIKKEIEEEEKDSSGEGTLGSGSFDGSSVDIDESYEEFVGHEPKAGEDLDEEVEAAEDNRRGIPPHEDEE